MKLVDVPNLLERLGVKAKRKGREWWACCPLHEERTPSWQMRDDTDDPEKHGRWRCLGACHTGGGPVGLVMGILGTDAKGAWQWLREGTLIERVPLSIEYDDEAPSLARFVFGFRLPLGVQFGSLEEWPEAARNYIKSRGVTEEQVDRWGIGYAVDGKLARRIVIPWRDAAGKLLGYTARTYLPGEKRYLEPGKDEGAARGAVYGEELWPAPGKRDVVVVTEGSFDGFAVERATGLPFGAACGSQFLPAHASKLSTFPRVIVVSDPDKAGKQMRDAIVEQLGRWSCVSFVELPKGFDPGRIEVQWGSGALAEMIHAAQA